jgi:hypothetical protein
LEEVNLCTNKNCKNNNPEYSNCEIEDIYCNLCGSLTLVGEFEGRNS